MNLELNSQRETNYKKISAVMLKCIVFALLSCAVTILSHAYYSAFIEGVHGKPEFVRDNIFIYSLGERLLFAIGYIVLGNKIPIKNSFLRGFTYIMLIWSSNFMPQLMGLAGADGAIAEIAFSVSTVICDSITYVVSGIILGILFKNVPEANKRSCQKASYIKTIAASAITFPLLIIAVDQLINKIYTPFSSVGAIGVSHESQLTFYLYFYSWFIISGALIAVFYRLTEYNEENHLSWFRFAMKYSILIWSPVVLIMIVFGTEIIPTFFYAAVFIFCITVISWINSKLLVCI